MAHRNLQIPLQKCVFLLYGPSWRACRVPCTVRFVLFLPNTHFSIQFSSLFSKICSPPWVGSTFLENGSKHFAFKNSLFGPLKPPNDDSRVTFLALIALCPDRFLIFRLRSPFKILLLAAVSCTFRLQGLLCKNACLQHT